MVTARKQECKSIDPNPFLGILQTAHAENLPVRISERIEGGRFTYTHSYPAALIARFVTAPRRGTVVVTGNMTRIKLKNIVSVTVETPDGAMLGTLTAIGPDGRL